MTINPCVQLQKKMEHEGDAFVLKTKQKKNMAISHTIKIVMKFYMENVFPIIVDNLNL